MPSLAMASMPTVWASSRIPDDCIECRRALCQNTGDFAIFVQLGDDALNVPSATIPKPLSKHVAPARHGRADGLPGVHRLEARHEGQCKGKIPGQRGNGRDGQALLRGARDHPLQLSSNDLVRPCMKLMAEILRIGQPDLPVRFGVSVCGLKRARSLGGLYLSHALGQRCPRAEGTMKFEEEWPDGSGQSFKFSGNGHRLVVYVGPSDPTQCENGWEVNISESRDANRQGTTLGAYGVDLYGSFWKAVGKYKEKFPATASADWKGVWDTVRDKARG